MAENGKPHKKLTRNQRRALLALLTSPSIRDAARACGLGERTVHRYLKSPDFQSALGEAQAAHLGELSRNLLRLSSDSVKVLARALTDADARVGVRAADVGLRHLLKLWELSQLESRLSALQQLWEEK